MGVVSGRFNSTFPPRNSIRTQVDVASRAGTLLTAAVAMLPRGLEVRKLVAGCVLAALLLNLCLWSRPPAVPTCPPQHLAPPSPSHDASQSLLQASNRTCEIQFRHCNVAGLYAA
jgi:hypothetical protein